MVAPPPNLCFQQKQWYLQCFTQILACRFGKLFLGGSHILIIYKIYMTCREETLKIQLTKLKNRKTEKLNPYGESLPGSLWKIQFFSFSVSLQIFRNSSVSKTEKQKNWKNWKTESIWRISPWISLENSVFQFFCFSVFQFWFRNYSGNFP